MSDIPQTCSVEPFRYQATPQPIGDQGASSNQINEQAIEDYLNRLRVAVCEDLTELFDSQVTPELSFLDLTDTPDSYAAAAGQLVAVNGTQTGLEFIPQPASPSTYFLTPRLAIAWPPNVTPGQFGPAPVAVSGGQIQIPTNPSNTLTATYRQGFTTGAAANSAAGLRATVFHCIVGTAAPMGGFRLRWRFGNDIYNAGARGFLGVVPTLSSILGTVDPSTMVNIAGIGYDDTDTNWQIMVNDAAGAATKVDLTGFAINATSLLELTIEIDPSAGTMDYLFRDLSLGTETSGTVTGNLPAGGAPLTPQLYVSSAATGVAQRISHAFMSLEVGPGE